jgi:hypothetical protein
LTPVIYIYFDHLQQRLQRRKTDAHKAVAI